MTGNNPTIRGLRARAVNVPMPRPLATAGGSVTTAPLVLVDLETDAGVTGSAYVFCYAPFALAPMVSLLQALGETLQGAALAPSAIHDGLMARFRLLGPQGLAGMAISAIDMAAWDALAKVAGQPLAQLLGGPVLPIRAYNSKGLGLIGPDRVAAEARELADEGFAAIKLRLGYRHARDDVKAVEIVLAELGGDIPVMTDYNQSLDPSEAQVRARLLADAGLVWIEEPVRFDDYAGCALVREASSAPIQIGENCWGVHDMQKALDAGSCDLFMPDAGKIGGVTGWMRAAGLAQGRGMPISSHLYPEISAHLLSVTPTRDWLEYVDWAAPILRQPLAVADGCIVAPDTPGIGMEWDEDAVARYSV